LPTLVPFVILSILWIWVLQPDSGVVNTILRYFGISGPGWFSSPTWAKPAFILMGLWGAGGSIIIYLAGLQGIPESLYEAASLDGASSLQKVFRITIPLLKPVILFNVITGIIGTFQSFAESFIITNGGPDGSTMFYSLYLYQNAFQYSKMGYASAMAWILLIIALAFTLILFRLSSRSEDQE
jgi:multiple sugar transport system permease protein